jgi:hypothetical protein
VNPQQPAQAGAALPAPPPPPLTNDDDKPYLRRWDNMHFALAALVIVISGLLIGIFAWRGDVQGMSSTAAIVSGWVGAVLGWFFTKSTKGSGGGSGGT